MTSRGWEIYTREVKPINKKRLKPRIEKTQPPKPVAKPAVPAEPQKIAAPRKLPDDIFRSLERKREKSFRQGDVEIDAKLDLHGKTQIEAFDALTAFIASAVKTGKRNLLIVTGKGRGGAGVLRRNLEGWLGQLPESSSILALRSAAPRHGGEGAFYVVLRRK
ncbi:MAG: Smr/MutS family protein [Bdellovibrionales bacterium]